MDYNEIFHGLKNQLTNPLISLLRTPDFTRAIVNYFKEKFIKNDRGNWVNPKDKTDLVLIWWKKE